mmetsp:Transcript_30553/g.65418  ORF Transcript_30553/g.65418 Transcript_30553/m.65418 type:complete len:397 (+) Transcript_30553:1480-2670(+)
MLVPRHRVEEGGEGGGRGLVPRPHDVVDVLEELLRRQGVAVLVPRPHEGVEEVVRVVRPRLVLGPPPLDDRPHLRVDRAEGRPQLGDRGVPDRFQDAEDGHGRHEHLRQGLPEVVHRLDKRRGPLALLPPHLPAALRDLAKVVAEGHAPDDVQRQPLHVERQVDRDAVNPRARGGRLLPLPLQPLRRLRHHVRERGQERLLLEGGLAQGPVPPVVLAPRGEDSLPVRREGVAIRQEAFPVIVAIRGADVLDVVRAGQEGPPRGVPQAHRVLERYGVPVLLGQFQGSLRHPVQGEAGHDAEGLPPEGPPRWSRRPPPLAAPPRHDLAVPGGGRRGIPLHQRAERAAPPLLVSSSRQPLEVEPTTTTHDRHESPRVQGSKSSRCWISIHQSINPWIHP